jgi:hypothetical protein
MTNMNKDMPDEKEEADKTRYASAMSELIQFVRLIAKRHRLTPMEVIGVWKLCEDVLLSGGANVEFALFMKQLKDKEKNPKGYL